MKPVPEVVTKAIDKAWELGHLLVGFVSDTEDSIVSACLRCDELVAVDGDELSGGAIRTKCKR